MEQYQTQHSWVEKKGKDYQSVPQSLHQTTGNRFLALVKVNQGFSLSSTGAAFCIPLFNLLRIDQGSNANQRNGNSIFIHRIEFDYSIRENPYNVNGPSEVAQPNLTTNGVLTDPRMRIMIVNPKSMYRVAPTSNNLTYPYYNASGDANHPEPLSPPVSIAQTNDWGMIGLPDPKKFDLEYEDVRNLQQNGQIGLDGGSFSFLVRRRFDFDQEKYISTGQIYFTDNVLQTLIPQIWFFQPPQATQFSDSGVASAWNDSKMVHSFNMRIIFDNLN